MDVSVIMLEFQQSKSYEKLEVPQIQLIVGVQDIPVVSQRQVTTVLQVQFLEVVDMPVVVQRQVRAAAVCRQGFQILVVAQRQIPMVPSVLQTIEILLLQSIDKVVYVLVVQVVQVSPVLVVEKTGGSHSCSSLRKALRSASSWTRLLHACWCATTGAWRDVQKTAVSPQLQFVDEVVVFPVVAQRQIPMMSLFR